MARCPVACHVAATRPHKDPTTGEFTGVLAASTVEPDNPQEQRKNMTLICEEHAPKAPRFMQSRLILSDLCSSLTRSRWSAQAWP